MNATFPKSERLCSKICIDELFVNGEACRLGGFMVKYLRVRANENIGENLGAENFPPLPKILISVPKRFQKRAVDRNRTKRLIREVYRKYKAQYLSQSNLHSLAIIYASSKVPDYTFVEEHLPKLLEKIK
ncbi:MAG: ribonuclease P protein component [Bacteroidales bacterium]|jgi:ribonuclease P protein component|nr:ribonuclease P protein component [Bacteroidales bacterium]